MAEQLRMRRDVNGRDTQSEAPQRVTAIPDNTRDVRSERPNWIPVSTRRRDARPESGADADHSFADLARNAGRTRIGMAARLGTSRHDSSSQLQSSRRTDEQVPPRPLISASDNNVSHSRRNNDQARVHVVLPISEPHSERQHSAALQIEEQRDRCYKYCQKALLFAFSAFFAYYLTPSSSSAGKTAFKFSMAAFLAAVCADLLSSRKPRDGSALVYLSSFSLMVMTFLMFISFNGYYGFAIIIVPSLIGAGLVQQKLRSERRQQITDDEEFNKLLSDIFDFSALILNYGGFITAFAATTMPSFTGINEHREVSFAGFVLLLTVILSLYLMMATTVRAQPLTLHVNSIYSLQQLLLLVMVCVFITKKLKGLQP